MKPKPPAIKNPVVRFFKTVFGPAFPEEHHRVVDELVKMETVTLRYKTSAEKIINKMINRSEAVYYLLKLQKLQSVHPEGSPEFERIQKELEKTFKEFGV